jgi:hypothetical protein
MSLTAQGALMGTLQPLDFTSITRSGAELQSSRRNFQRFSAQWLTCSTGRQERVGKDRQYLGRSTRCTEGRYRLFRNIIYTESAMHG